jgi:hypothetical protein
MGRPSKPIDVEMVRKEAGREASGHNRKRGLHCKLGGGSQRYLCTNGERDMQFFVLQPEPIVDRQTALVDAYREDGTETGDAPRCEACGDYVGSLVWLPPYRVELEPWGPSFGDVAFTSADVLLVSQRFKQVWEGSKLAGLGEFDPVEVVKIKRHRKRLGDPPPYFLTRLPRSRTAIDLAASEFEWESPPTCDVCRLGQIVKRWKRVIIDQSTWTGEDIFFARGLSGSIFVSARFKEFIGLNGIANAHLLPAESYAHDFYPWEKEASPPASDQQE